MWPPGGDTNNALGVGSPSPSVLTCLGSGVIFSAPLDKVAAVVLAVDGPASDFNPLFVPPRAPVSGVSGGSTPFEANSRARRCLAASKAAATASGWRFKGPTVRSGDVHCGWCFIQRNMRDIRLVHFHPLT